MLNLSNKLSLNNTRASGTSAPDLDFVITVDTTIAGSSGVGVMNLAGAIGTPWNADVDWGDGTSDTGVTSAPSHTYSSAGVYTIRMSGVIVFLNFANGYDKLKITNIANWGIMTINYNGAFNGCANLTCTATDAPTITTGDFRNTFKNCPVFNGAIGNWDTSLLTRMDNMFSGASVFDQNLGDWDISSCTNFNNIGTGNTFSTASLDGIYIGWSAQSVQTAQSINFGTTKYTGGGAAAAGKAVLEGAPNNWTTLDGGIA